jgi:hypothetical protein
MESLISVVQFFRLAVKFLLMKVFASSESKNASLLLNLSRLLPRGGDKFKLKQRVGARLSQIHLTLQKSALSFSSASPFFSHSATATFSNSQRQ